MTSQAQSQANKADVNSAWEIFRSMVHRSMPGTTATVVDVSGTVSTKRGFWP